MLRQKLSVEDSMDTETIAKEEGCVKSESCDDSLQANTSDLHINLAEIKQEIEALRSVTYDSEASPASSTSHQSQKGKKISLGYDQLRTLNAFFEVIQYPDANDREQLKQKTGLPRRVLQVWFQNRRARLRRKRSDAAFTEADSVSNEPATAGSVPTSSRDSTSLPSQPNINPFTEALRSVTYDSEASPAFSTSHQSQRGKRTGCSIGYDQLRTLNAFFEVNQNPNANDREQLEQKTGLCKRVLQNWFKIRRARWRTKFSLQKRSDAAFSETDSVSNEPATAGSVPTSSRDSTSLPLLSKY